MRCSRHAHWTLGEGVIWKKYYLGFTNGMQGVLRCAMLDIMAMRHTCHHGHALINHMQDTHADDILIGAKAAMLRTHQGLRCQPQQLPPQQKAWGKVAWAREKIESKLRY